jgi:hemoglobin-like flavoprotein
VRTMLGDLAKSFEEIHQKGWVRGELCASNVLVDSNGTVRLSTVDLSTVLTEQSLMPGTFTIDREALTYMTPERFFGRPHTQQADQFSLGLIATELLGGEPLPRVRCPSDLQSKSRLFQDLAEGRGGWAKRSKGFSGIVSRLLRTNPEDRWPSMTHVRELVRAVDIVESEGERTRMVARDLYVRLQDGGHDRVFFDLFYRTLFAKCPETKVHFESIDMQRQHMLLNQAIFHLLEFHPASGCEKLRDLANRHRGFSLNPEHYQSFLEALVSTMEQSGVADSTQIAAWREVLAPGVEFMRVCQGT